MTSGPWPYGATISAGTTLTIPAGVTFDLDDTVTLGANVSFVGTGTVCLGPAGVFRPAGSGVSVGGITVTTTDTWGTFLTTGAGGSCTGWTFTDTTFDNVSLVLDASKGIAGVALTDTEHRNFQGTSGYVLEIVGIDGATLTRVWSHDNGISEDVGEGIKVRGAAINTHLIDCISEYNTRDGLDAYDAHYTTVTRGHYRYNLANGIEMKWATTDTNPTGHNVLDAVEAHNNTLCGIAAGTPNTTLQNCITDNNGIAGIRVGSAFNDANASTSTTTVQYCTARGNVLYGILLGNAVDHITVTQNTATANGVNIGTSPLSATCTITSNTATGALSGLATDEIRVGGTGHTVTGNTGIVTYV